MLLFRSEQHVERWCQQWKQPRGGVLTVQQGWKLAKLWYGDRLAAHWCPKTTSEAQKIFSDIGLMGEFWKLSS
jgi:Alkylmercury lyase